MGGSACFPDFCKSNIHFAFANYTVNKHDMHDKHDRRFVSQIHVPSDITLGYTQKLYC